MEPSNDDKVLLDVYRKLEREKHIIQGTRTVRQSTTNVAVQQRCDTTIREAEKNISYLEETMRQLKLRKNPGTGGSSTASGQSSTTPTLHHHNVSNASTVSSMSSSASLPPVPPKEGLTSSPSETTLSRAGMCSRITNRRFQGNVFFPQRSLFFNLTRSQTAAQFHQIRPNQI